MNFEALNWLINSILDWYLCPHCWAKVDKRNINIKNIVSKKIKEIDIKKLIESILFVRFVSFVYYHKKWYFKSLFEMKK